MNFDLTKNLLELVANYASMMILLGQIEDRKAIAGGYFQIQASCVLIYYKWTILHSSIFYIFFLLNTISLGCVVLADSEMVLFSS